MYGNSIHLIDYIDILCRGSLSEIIMDHWNPHNPRLVSARFNFDSGDVYVQYGTLQLLLGVRVLLKVSIWYLNQLRLCLY